MFTIDQHKTAELLSGRQYKRNGQPRKNRRSIKETLRLGLVDPIAEEYIKEYNKPLDYLKIHDTALEKLLIDLRTPKTIETVSESDIRAYIKHKEKGFRL